MISNIMICILNALSYFTLIHLSFFEKSLSTVSGVLVCHLFLYPPGWTKQ